MFKNKEEYEIDPNSSFNKLRKLQMTLKEEVAELYVDASTLRDDVSTLAENLSDAEIATANAIADLENRKADKGDVCTVWKDVHDLLEDARNDQ